LTSFQDDWILAKFFFRGFMDRDGVEVQNLAKNERGQYPAILVKQAWSIKNFIIMLLGKGFLRDTAGHPERVRERHLARSGCKSQRRI